MGGKKYVSVTVFGTGASEIEYSGRCLGLLTDKEYADIVGNALSRRKLYTVETTPIRDLLRVDNVEGLRLAIAIKSKNAAAAKKQAVFITEPIDFVNTVLSCTEIALSTSKSYITIAEHEQEVYKDA